MQLVEKKTCKQHCQKKIMFLPHELIIQILLWLPVKSLIRFKCVCKSWFSLISHDPHFTNSHFQLTATTTPNHKILFISTFPFETLSINFEPLLDDYNASVSLNLECIFPEYPTHFEIKGSCRGFILFCCSSKIYIWNPSTGVHRQIPISPFGGSKLDVDYFYGFGYDHSAEDYLVVLMSHHDSDNPPLHLEYFSLRGNTWNEVEGPHYRYTDRNIHTGEPRGGLLYNGAIHWLAYRDDLQTEVIVAFDLMEKKLSYMLLPCSPMHCSLWVYGEFLSVYTTDYSNDTVVIFVMNEYKVNSSWTMTLALPVDVIPVEDFSPLCCTKIGDIVGTDDGDDGSGLVKYDKNGQFLEHHSYTNDDFRCQVTMYVESLLSLPSDGDNHQA
ncbi:F-box/kelch-repeat protein At3g23880-like [Vicia villosa]|uniref:F-box/kelch-repeat protein At3g23880-like n=1 Tax=Vicia villosa TaxID=3911 RepID=UPI00273B7AEB|nr:F-box/kelch-repeat protein At3g23880-like [Vicia villosa]